MFIVGLTVDGPIGQKDVLLELDSNGLWQSAADLISQRVPLPATDIHFVISRSGQILSPSTPLRNLDLRWGDKLALREGKPNSLSEQRSLVPVDSNSLGTIPFLNDGVYIVGRDHAQASVIVDVPSVSRNHATVTVTSSRVTIADNGSSNGTTINGSDITGPAEVHPGDVVSFGLAAFRFEDAAVVSAPTQHRAFEGLVSFNRPPRHIDEVPATRVTLTAPPKKVESRKLPLVTYLAPIAGAGVAAAVSQRPITLLIALVSPLMYLITNLGEKRSGAKDYRSSSATFRTLIDTRSAEARESLASYVNWANRKWPPSQTLEPLAHNLDERLWWRRPHDDDFLQVRLGTSERISPIELSMPEGGSDELRDYVNEKFGDIVGSQILPLPLGLRTAGALGIVGDESVTFPFLNSLALQIATEQSHRDVTIDILAPDRAEQFDDLKWLPHVTARGLDAAIVALDDSAEVPMIRKLQAIKEDRLGKDGFGRDALSKSPHHVIIVCPPITTNRAQISDFLTGLADVNMTVIWVAPERALLPGECSTVISLGRDGVGNITSEKLSTTFSAEFVSNSASSTLGRDLAPLRDTAASVSSNMIPDSVSLTELPQFSKLSLESLLAQWQHPDGDLRFPIGVGDEGEFSLSLVSDGPHGLVAGMTGAGKSELLQTMIASLSLSYSPDFVNFVLIDYKGGSAFRSCRLLPHTVGFVTDLDDGLAERAIISLNAELRRREHVITNVGGAKDIIEFRRLHPTESLPSLVIVIDEFAFLVKELPQFVDRLVDIAQRGRSLGVHLILATQRPSGVISAQIQANTNLRIALRVASTSDSSDVIDSPIASTILPAQRGRAYFKTGPKKPQEIQAAYSGGSQTIESDVTGRAMTFSLSKMDLRSLDVAKENDSDTPSDLDVVVALCQEAFERSGLAAPLAPWLDPLPETISVSDLTEMASPGDTPLGLIDLPERQDRGVLTYLPSRDQNIMILGAPRTGKTNALCCIAASLSAQSLDRAPWMYGIDFGHGGLQRLAQLPTWGGTASASTLESVARLVDLLDGLSVERQSTAEAQRSALRPIITFIDNWSGLTSALQNVEYIPYLDRLQRLIADGRGIGMYFVVTGDREGVFSPTVSSAIGHAWTFRLANAQDVGTRHRQAAGRLLSLPVGRALDTNGAEVQFVFPAPLPDFPMRTEFQGLTQPGAQPTLRLLPDRFPLSGLDGPRDRYSIPLGIDESWRQVNVNFGDNPYFLVVGNPRTGKSTVANTLIDGIVRSEQTTHRFLIANRRTPLADRADWTSTAIGTDGVQALIPEIRDAVTMDGSRVLLVADDADDWADISSSLNGLLDAILKTGMDHGLLFLGVVSVNRAQRTFSSWLGAVKTQQCGFLLGGGPENADIFQIRLPRNLSPNEPPGRGYFVSPRGNVKVHVAITD